jgi:hypothetical protein
MMLATHSQEVPTDLIGGADVLPEEEFPLIGGPNTLQDMDSNGMRMGGMEILKPEEPMLMGGMNIINPSYLP